MTTIQENKSQATKISQSTQPFKKPSKRKGRLKIGEVIEASGFKTMTKEEAFASIEGLKYKIANKYRSFCDNTVNYEDLISAANVGVAWAYRDWDANTAKFITFAHNRIERQIDLYLTDMIPRYKNNVDAKNWLRRKNDESFQQLQERNITKDKDFNELHGLDSIKTFTKEHYNLYTQKVANKLFNNGESLVINPASAFVNNDSENFDILDVTASSTNSLEEVEFEQELSSLDSYSKNIATMLHEGYSIGEVAKKLKISKKKLLSQFNLEK